MLQGQIHALFDAPNMRIGMKVRERAGACDADSIPFPAVADARRARWMISVIRSSRSIGTGVHARCVVVKGAG